MAKSPKRPSDRSAFAPWHPCHERRVELRVTAFRRGWDALTRLWVRRGWSFKVHSVTDGVPDLVSVDIEGSGRYFARWQVRRGWLALPGERIRRRAHDPVQAQVALDEGAERLRRLRDLHLLPHQARRGWPDLPDEP